jgi:hypothetical protein
MTQPATATSQPAAVAEEKPALALDGTVDVTCALYGDDGENADDCTTHAHQYAGTVRARLDHLVYTEHVDGLLDDLAERVTKDVALSEDWTIEYAATGVADNGQVVLLHVIVNT